VDPVPDPLLLRKSGSAGNRTRTSGLAARKADATYNLKMTPLIEICSGKYVKTNITVLSLLFVIYLYLYYIIFIWSGTESIINQTAYLPIEPAPDGDDDYDYDDCGAFGRKPGREK
jgi:hypothetical protein